MKKGLLLIAFVITAIFSVNAQVEIKSPHRDLSVKFVECGFYSGDVYFDLLITNLAKDATLDINNVQTKAFDDLGNGYNCNTGIMKSGLVTEELNSMSMSRSVTYAIPKDVPIRFRFKIENVSDEANKFTFVSISLNSVTFVERLSGNRKPLEIRNMPFEIH